MPSILQKVQVLLQADMNGMLDLVLETKKMMVIDVYIRQVARNIEALGDSIEMVAGSARTLKRKYEEFAAQAEKMDRDVDTFILRGKDELAIADDSWGLNTKAELAQEYFEQWQTQEEQHQDMLAMRGYLKQRLIYVQQVHDTIQASIDNNETLSDTVLESLHTEADVENVRYHTWQAERQKRLNQIEADIRRVDLELEERKRRLLGKNRDDDK